MTRSRVLKSLIAIVAASLMGFVAVPSQANVAPAQTINESTVGMQMFMWNWKSLGNECRTQLGPAGVNWILVMPPQDSISGSAWWTHYQPVSYAIDSNMGTRAEFASMVAKCNEAGVDVIADAVINHMASGSYHFPNVPYTNTNFHYFSPEHNCQADISDYSNVTEVQDCQLGSLVDLATEQPFVRSKIAAYLNDLLSLGVKGFRIDAAKHIPVVDLAAIKSQLTDPNVFIVNEVIGGPPEPTNYYQIGALFSFDWSSGMKSAFGSYNGAPDLDVPNSQYNGMGTSSLEVTMVNNHDTERNGNSLTYLDGKKYLMAMIYTLSEPFGVPMLYSGYAFSDFNAAPTYKSGLNVCNTGTGVKSSYIDGYMICTDRWTAVQGMIRWHKWVLGETKIRRFSDNYAYGYARGTKGFVLFNSASGTKAYAVRTGLRPGTYCDVVSGGKSPIKIVKGKRTCVGVTVTVDAGTRLITKVPGMTAVAIASYSKR
ncbi:MAG: alpha-amylase family glycosyl hydrolase [Rhodoluna sp.]|nr:alpha-amylase family glycosyl hydrolase [Rhodoluna sp.]